MPLLQSFDPGGEIYLSFAKKKLRDMHAKMIWSGVRVLHLTVLATTDAVIYLDSLLLAPGIFKDAIRITTGGSYLVGASMSDPTPYRSLFLDTDSDALRVIMSDGTVLASVPRTTVDGTNFTPTFAGTAWSGGHQELLSDGSVLSFVVPPDTSPVPAAQTGHVMFSGGALGRVLTGAWFGVVNSVTVVDGTTLYYRPTAGDDPVLIGAFSAATFYGFGMDSTSLNVWLNASQYWPVSDLASTYPADPPNYNSTLTVIDLAGHTSAAHAEAVAREKARLQTNSTNALNMLKAGIMPPDTRGQFATSSGLYVDYYGWEGRIKINAPVSALPRLPVPFTATLIQDTTVGNIIGGTRSVYLSFTDADGVLHEETITGTKTITTDSFGIKTIAYVNYPAFEVTGTNEGTLRQADRFESPSMHGPVRDTFAVPLAQVLNGLVVDSTLLSDSTFGPTPSDPAGVRARPYRSNTVVGSPAALYMEYLASVNPADVTGLPAPKPAYSSKWLSTAMVPGEAVTLIPFAPVLAGEDLGMFGPTTGATQVATYGYANFRYNIDGSFTFVSWHDDPQVTDMLDSAGAAITWPGTNCIVKYTKFGWKDTQTTAAVQATALTNPVTQANKFLALIKHAVGI